MNYSNSTTDKTEKLKDTKTLAFQWDSMDWCKIENDVNRLQSRIAKATAGAETNKAKRLQYLLTHSLSAKAYAVRKVTTNQGKKTPGVDKKIWSTSASKMKAVLQLTDKQYRAKPLRRVYIEKKNGKKKRPLGIPAMITSITNGYSTIFQWTKELCVSSLNPASFIKENCSPHKPVLLKVVPSQASTLT